MQSPKVRNEFRFTVPIKSTDCYSEGQICEPMKRNYKFQTRVKKRLPQGAGATSGLGQELRTNSPGDMTCAPGRQCPKGRFASRGLSG